MALAARQPEWNRTSMAPEESAGLRFAVASADTEENTHSGPNFAYNFICHANLGLRYSLDDDAHN